MLSCKWEAFLQLKDTREISLDGAGAVVVAVVNEGENGSVAF